jgi:hypothetical protein
MLGNSFGPGRYIGAERPMKSRRYRKKVGDQGYFIDFPQY